MVPRNSWALASEATASTTRRMADERRPRREGIMGGIMVGPLALRLIQAFESTISQLGGVSTGRRRFLGARLGGRDPGGVGDRPWPGLLHLERLPHLDRAAGDLVPHAEDQ